MSKNQYQSTEILKIRIAPFVNKVTGDYITTGLDTCTLTIKRPDGSALPSGPHTATWDSTVHMWTFDVPVISYQQGGKLITHRVVGTQDGHYITQGDNTSDPDPWQVSPRMERKRGCRIGLPTGSMSRPDCLGYPRITRIPMAGK